MTRSLALALLTVALTGCASTRFRDPGLSAEADRSTQRAVASQKDGMHEVAQLQDARADRLNAQSKRYGFGDWLADTQLLNSGTSGSKRR